MSEPARTEIVVKSNALVNAMFDLGLQANRFLAFAISNLDRATPRDPGQPVDLEIDVPAFAAAFEITSKNAYREVEALADQLQRKIIQFENKPGERIKVGLITRQRYLDGEGRVWLRFDEDLVPHLLGLRDKFTRYRIRDVYQFQRASTWRVYELLKQFKEVGKREFDLDEFKLKIGVSGLYDRVGNLKQRVIDPAVLEINATSDILVQWEQIKRGRRVAKLRFHIQDNPASKTEREQKRATITKLVEQRQGPLKNPEWAEKLRKEFGVSKVQAERVARLWVGREPAADKILARIKTDWMAGKVKRSLGGYVFQVLKDEAQKISLPGL